MARPAERSSKKGEMPFCLEIQRIGFAHFPLAKPFGLLVHVPSPSAQFLIFASNDDPPTSRDTRRGTHAAARIASFRSRSRDTRRFYLRNSGSRFFRCRDRECNRD